MPARKETIRYEARQRLVDAIVVRRSLVRHTDGTRTVEDILGRYQSLSTAADIARAMNDARHDEAHHA
jgi:hypothetical protein